MSRMKKEDEDSWTYLIASCLTCRGLTISSAERFAIEGDFWISLGATVARGKEGFLARSFVLLKVEEGSHL